MSRNVTRTIIRQRGAYPETDGGQQEISTVLLRSNSDKEQALQILRQQSSSSGADHISCGWEHTVAWNRCCWNGQVIQGSPCLHGVLQMSNSLPSGGAWVLASLGEGIFCVSQTSLSSPLSGCSPNLSRAFYKVKSKWSQAMKPME